MVDYAPLDAPIVAENSAALFSRHFVDGGGS
jgi:hypothetical protein